MPNHKGWLCKEEVLETGLPYYIPSSQRWTAVPYPFSVLLSKTRCIEFGLNIQNSNQEKPVAFRYAALAGSGTSDDKRYRYIPLYDRTSAFTSGEFNMNLLFSHEKMGAQEGSR